MFFYSLHVPGLDLSALSDWCRYRVRVDLVLIGGIAGRGAAPLLGRCSEVEGSVGRRFAQQR